MGAMLRNERGSAVIIAVTAVLVLSVLTLSFVLLADIESRAGASYTHQAQAEMLAEAALERARDAVRTAPQGFTGWFDGTRADHLLFSAQELNGGRYWARIDNDCAAAVPGFPAAIEEPDHQPGNRPCDNATDSNATAVVTAWAVSGSGRARVRAVVGVDNPWTRVCANAKADHLDDCTGRGNPTGSPTVTPADPNDPNGPRAYVDLPRPILGCSRIAPGIHRGPYSLAQQTAGCAANPGMHVYPYPVAFDAPPRLVVMGEDPVATTARFCYQDPVNPAIRYFGYFDCALQTYCDPSPPASMPCGSWGTRKACVVAGDSRLADAAHYVPYQPGTGQCGTGGANETGLVCLPAGGCNGFTQDVGSPTLQFTMYVFRQNWSQGTNRRMHGTLVVEGTAAGGTVFQAGAGAGARLSSGPNGTPPEAGSIATHQYGFPIVALIYNPELAPPTIQPGYLPQPHAADFGTNDTQIHGMIYSGGHVLLNPVTLDGTVVAFEMRTRGRPASAYNAWYGSHTPPPGFPFGGNTPVVINRKSFAVCTNYRDESAGPTACN